jgi:hypothetical protein
MPLLILYWSEEEGQDVAFEYRSTSGGDSDVALEYSSESGGGQELALEDRK